MAENSNNGWGKMGIFILAMVAWLTNIADVAATDATKKVNDAKTFLTEQMATAVAAIDKKISDLGSAISNEFIKVRLELTNAVKASTDAAAAALGTAKTELTSAINNVATAAQSKLDSAVTGLLGGASEGYRTLFDIESKMKQTATTAYVDSKFDMAANGIDGIETLKIQGARELPKRPSKVAENGVETFANGTIMFKISDARTGDKVGNAGHFTGVSQYAGLADYLNKDGNLEYSGDDALFITYGANGIEKIGFHDSAAKSTGTEETTGGFKVAKADSEKDKAEAGKVYNAPETQKLLQLHPTHSDLRISITAINGLLPEGGRMTEEQLNNVLGNNGEILVE